MKIFSRLTHSFYHFQHHLSHYFSLLTSRLLLFSSFREFRCLQFKFFSLQANFFLLQLEFFGLHFTKLAHISGFLLKTSRHGFLPGLALFLWTAHFAWVTGFLFKIWITLSASFSFFQPVFCSNTEFFLRSLTFLVNQRLNAYRFLIVSSFWLTDFNQKPIFVKCAILWISSFPFVLRILFLVLGYCRVDSVSNSPRRYVQISLLHSAGEGCPHRSSVFYSDCPSFSVAPESKKHQSFLVRPLLSCFG